MKAVLARKQRVADQTYTFFFTSEKKVHYDAGQFTELYIPHTADNRGERRWFTLSSAPHETELAITTKFSSSRFGAQSSSFKKALQNLQPGTSVLLSDPMGDFVLPKDTSIPLLFVAAGMGVTPFRSMIAHLLHTKELRAVRMLYAAHTPRHLAFLDVFRAYKELDLHTLAQSQPGARREINHAPHSQQERPLTASLIYDNLPGADALIYLAGPEELVEALRKELQAAGMPLQQIIVDYFHGYN